MFPGDSGTELDVGFLRSGRIFHSRKRRKTLTGRGSFNTTKEEEDYELALYFDEVSCSKEEDYHSISKGEE